MALAAAALAGCATIRYDPEKATRSYPFWLKQGETVDVQVITEGETILIVNATPVDYQNVDIWLNQRYLHHADRIAPGENKRLYLGNFWDVRGEGPHPGGAFRYYPPTPVRLVQLQIDETSPLIGLQAVLTEDETR